MEGLTRGEKPWPLFLHGLAGLGKTCIGLLLLDYAGGLYFSTSTLLEKLIQSQQGRLEWHQGGYGGVIWPEQFWNQIRRSPLVVLDELGARDKVSDHHFDSIKRLIDERESKPLVAISNLDLGRIGHLYDDRIASRLSSGTVVKLSGEDRRIRKHD